MSIGSILANLFAFRKLKKLFQSPTPAPEDIMSDVQDPTAWMLDNSLSEFLLMPGGVLYMCMLGYTFLHGCKVFKAFPKNASLSFKIVSMVLACTGGGILVPIFLNGIPVPLANDAYPIAILTSFALHYYFPVLREVAGMSTIFKVLLVVFYECTRSGVVVKLTYLAGSKIAASTFGFPLFGPIACGTIGGCGGAFLPFSKGLDPIKAGLASPMQTAFVGATCFHLYLNTSMSEGCVNAKSKAHVCMTLFFIAVGIVNALGLSASAAKTVAVKTKSE